MQRKTPHQQSGIMLLEILAGLAILAMVITGVAMMISKNTEENRLAQAAQHLKTVGDAAAAYIRSNYSSVIDGSTDTVPLVIPVNTLIAAGNLPVGFNAANSFNQTACVLVLENTGTAVGTVTALVVTEGGTAVDDVAVNTIANLLGASGGAIRASDPANFNGARNGWQLALGNFANSGTNCSGAGAAVSLAPGHPAMALWLASGGINADVLYRTAIPGRQDLNQMTTPLVLPTNGVLGQACKDSNGAALSNGAISSSAAGNILVCKGGVWSRSDINRNLIMRRSLNPADRWDKSALEARCDSEKGEAFVAGMCSMHHCGEPQYATGGQPIVRLVDSGPEEDPDSVKTPSVVGWKCPRQVGIPIVIAYQSDGVTPIYKWEARCKQRTAYATCTRSSFSSISPGTGKLGEIGLIVDTTHAVAEPSDDDVPSYPE